ncbi:MAG: hypothetical protein ICV83_05430 [Cytophagales bacterium]|nr:hypothetical protein [Cytophagales bacterium]
MGGSYVPLALTPGIRGVYLKALTGAEELAVEDTSSRSALRLLAGLLSEDGLAPGNGSLVVKVVTADRDRLLAHLFLATYGNKVSSTLACSHCAKPFDIDFSLPDLLRHYAIEAFLPAGDGTYELAPAVHFRLPTGEDELAIAHIAPQQAVQLLLEKCIVSSTPGVYAERVQQRMAEMAPVLNVEMEAACPECGYGEPVLFDMQSFLLQKLLQERPRVLREIHLIASRYHWSQQEIVSLPRKVRKQYAAMIEAENESW